MDQNILQSLRNAVLGYFLREKQGDVLFSAALERGSSPISSSAVSPAAPHSAGERSSTPWQKGGDR